MPDEPEQAKPEPRKVDLNVTQELIDYLTDRVMETAIARMEAVQKYDAEHPQDAQ